MTAAVLDRPGSAAEDVERAAGGRGLTLEERLSEALRAASANGVAACPVCHSHMVAVRGGAAACRGCGSRLS